MRLMTYMMMAIAVIFVPTLSEAQDQTEKVQVVDTGLAHSIDQFESLYRPSQSANPAGELMLVSTIKDLTIVGSLVGGAALLMNVGFDGRNKEFKVPSGLLLVATGLINLDHFLKTPNLSLKPQLRQIAGDIEPPQGAMIEFKFGS